MKTFTTTFLVSLVSLWQPAFAGDPEDIAALKALDNAYAAAWMESDAERVLAYFTENATLVPHHGDAPVKGKVAIRKYWFDPEYAPTVIKEWQRKQAEVFVSGHMGVVRGRARLVWDYDGTRTTIPDSNYVLIAVRENNVWRIRMAIWNDDPRLWLHGPVD